MAFEKQLPALWLALAALAVYGATFHAPFLYDDYNAIVDNLHLRRLWPPGPVLQAPPQSSVAGRPVVSLSLALNYAISGLDPWSYHAVNLLLHIGCAWLVFASLRRLTPRLAWPIALLWTVHPLLTESVTYVIQRTELLMAFFLLSTVYAVVRTAEAISKEPTRQPGNGSRDARPPTTQPGGRASREPQTGDAQPVHVRRGDGNEALHEPAVRSVRLALWPLLAIMACGLGMASKETMVVAPVLVFLFDGTFLARSFADAWRARHGVYFGLAATWVVLGLLVLSGARNQTVGLGFQSLTPASYALTQAGVVVHYLRLAVWPVGLTLDYDDWPVARAAADVWPQLIVLGLLLAGTGWGLARRSWLGLAGAWFFLILAPTSTVVPIISEIAAERRMYLPLIAVLAVGVVAIDWVVGRVGVSAQAVPGPDGVAELRPPEFPPTLEGGALRRHLSGWSVVGRWRICGTWVVAVALAVGLGWGTWQRNQDYRSAFGIWSDTIAKRPASARAHINLGEALVGRGELDAAMGEYRRALELKPGYAEAHYNLGILLAVQGRPAEARQQLLEALRRDPGHARAHANLGLLLIQAGELAEAERQLRAAVELAPENATAQNALGVVLARQGRFGEARRCFTEAIRWEPANDEFRRNLARAVAGLNQGASAR